MQQRQACEKSWWMSTDYSSDCTALWWDICEKSVTTNEQQWSYLTADLSALPPLGVTVISAGKGDLFNLSPHRDITCRRETILGSTQELMVEGRVLCTFSEGTSPVSKFAGEQSKTPALSPSSYYWGYCLSAQRAGGISKGLHYTWKIKYLPWRFL